MLYFYHYNNKWMSIGKRLKKAIKNAGMKMTDFSKKSDIPYRTIQGYVADNNIPGGELIIKMCKELHISTDWLLTGEGEMHRTKPSPNEMTLEPILEWFNKCWKEADEKHRIWLEVQMEKCFPEYEKWVKERSQSK